jgi:nucleotide-binding universal stress UspA family protein
VEIEGEEIMPGKRHSSPFHKILVGYDGSKAAQKALEIAFAMAQSEDAQLFVVAVARPSEPATRVETKGILENAQEHFEQDFQRMTARAKELDVSLETAVVVGHPTEQLLHRAETEKADLIIVGRRGVSRFERMLVGSTSEKVLRYANCPVMVVH